ncbi:MAG: hypothetical protein U0457_17890 [Candidatus Sericytochromatia bacterium]
MNKFFSTVFLSTILAFSSANAFAKDLTVNEIISSVNSKGMKTSFTGKKVQMTVRRELRLEATANVSYVDKENLNVSLKSPSGISGIDFGIYKSKSVIHFPYEKLAFAESALTAGDMLTDTIIGKITNEQSLLEKNYNITLLPNDEISGKKCFVVKLTPKDGRNGTNSYWGTPAKTFWINTDTFNIMREDRYWGENIEPFFSSQYKEYKAVSYKEAPNIRIKLPYNTKKVLLDKQQPKIETFLEVFKTPEEIEKKFKFKVATPSYLPNGFKLREIMIMNFYDTKIVIEKFDDGLNSLFVTYRTKPNIFLVLTAGSFSIPLIQKMSDLSLNAPYNYMGKETNENLIISFGDLYPDDLKLVNNSLELK